MTKTKSSLMLKSSSRLIKDQYTNYNRVTVKSGNCEGAEIHEIKDIRP
jgi:hypothetical protein